MEIGHSQRRLCDVELNGRADKIFLLCQLLTLHLGRLRSLRVHSESSQELAWLFKHFHSVNAPLLQSLEIFSKRPFTGFSPYHIFTGGTPCWSLSILLM